MKNLFFVGTSPYKFRSSTPPPEGTNVSRLLISKPIPHLIVTDLNADDLLGRWKDVIMFYCLRLLLGPVIETLLLLDRLLYLRERGRFSFVSPTFLKRNLDHPIVYPGTRLSRKENDFLF